MEAIKQTDILDFFTPASEQESENVLDNFKTTLFYSIKELIAEHLIQSEQIDSRGKIKLDNRIWSECQRLAMDVSDIIAIHKA